MVVRWAAAGTHTGPGLGVPPSGRKVRFRGMTWMRFRDGKLVEGQDSWNLAGLLQALDDWRSQTPSKPLKTATSQ